MATDHKREAVALFAHTFQRFEDVPLLAA
jgi:hypothetical protein